MYDSLMVYITDNCNRYCEDCFVHFGDYELSVDQAVDIVNIAGYVDKLYVSGGEPTVHTQFDSIATVLSSVPHKTMILATNGYKLKDCIETLELFDVIRISNYTDNTDVITEFMKLYIEGCIRVIDMSTMIHDSTGSNSCGRHNNGIAAVYKGKVYGCCVAAGIYEAEGRKFDEDWREQAGKSQLPCDVCVFAI